MPGMDIRNFFGKKGGPPATKKKKGEEAAATPAEAVHKKSNPVVKQVESKKANASPKQQHQEQPPKHTKKKLVIVDSDDDDDDAVVVEKVVPSKRKASTSRAQAPREAISAEDYFIDSDAEDKPATKKTKKPEMNNFFDEDSDDDDDDGNAPSVSPTKRAKTLAQNSPATGKSDDSSTTPRLRSSPRAKAKTLQQTNEKVPASRFARKKSPPPKRPPVAAVKRDAPLVPLLQRNGIDMDAVASLCLTGYTFVFTGVMTELAREEAVEKIKILGGRVTTTVSSKTDYLVLGEILEDGRPTDQGSKYKRAIKERNVAFVQGATAFYGLLQQYSDKVGGGGNDNNNHSTSSNRAAVKPQTSPPARLAAEMAAGADSTRKLLPSSGATVTSPDPPPQSAAEAATTITVTPPVLAAMNPYAKKANPYIKTNPYATKKAVTTTANGNPRATDDGKPAAAQPRGAASTATPTNGGTNPLWVDKYKPVRSSEILGNQDAVRKLSVWLASWEERFNSNANIGKTYSAPNGPWKAALLSGPPGIGSKSECARIYIYILYILCVCVCMCLSICLFAFLSAATITEL